MEKDELLKRAEELYKRCERQECVTGTLFLSPAECCAVEKWAKRIPEAKLYFFGGHESCERKQAFFLPYYYEPEDLDFSEYIKAIKIHCPYGEPGHRDYMGALLGMGIDRSRLGDIRLSGNEAWVFCAPTVLKHLLSIDKVGRYSVSAAEISLKELELPELETVKRSFTVMSARLDAVVSGMFHISRTEAMKQINQGNVSLNYEECAKSDRQVNPGDIISLKGRGKGRLEENGGTSKKGRIFINATIYK